jgi:protocatechuate 3,4-dioxygenase beta subunit
MSPRVTFAALAFACLGALAWLLVGSEERRTAEPAKVEGHADVAARPHSTALEPVADVSAPTSSAARREAAGAAPAPAARIAHPWAGRLAGVSGRVVEVDGTPVPRLRVELLQADATLLFNVESTALGVPSLELDEARTDDAGRFALDGATLGAFHLLGLDRGGPRATLRFCERALVLGERVDLGDIVLGPSGIVFGRVVDEDGEPVAGARVRVGTVPDVAVELGLVDLRADSLLAWAPSADGLSAIELPRLVVEQLERLPISTTTTAADGSFRLAGVPLARVSGGVDHPGHVAAIIPAFDMPAGERDLGELELTFGRTLVGRVVDAAHDPVAGVEVQAGVLQSLAPFGVLHPAGVTDSAGKFSLRGVPEVGAVVGFARRRPTDPWVGARDRQGDERLEFVWPGAGSLRVEVTDHTGARVRFAQVRLVPADRELDGLAAVAAVADARSVRERPSVSEVEPGVYVATSVTFGTWRVEALADGLAPACQTFAHRADGTRVALTSGLGQSLAVIVRDAVTGAPVASAHASLVAPNATAFGLVGSGWTSPAGIVDLGPFEPLADAVARADESFGPSDVVLRVLHPDYGEHCNWIEHDTTAIEVALTKPCEIVGRVHHGGAPPDRRYTVTLEGDHFGGLLDLYSLPYIDLTQADGSFRFTGVRAGSYSLSVSERYFVKDTLALATALEYPLRRFDTDIEVEPGEPLRVEVDLTPTGLGPMASVAGTVRVNGLPLPGARVALDGNGGVVVVTTDSSGGFESGPISAVDGASITIEGEVALPGGRRERRQLYKAWHRLEHGERKQIDVDVALRALAVEVVDGETGKPVRDALVTLFRAEEGTATDAAGVVEVLIAVEAGFEVEVRAEGYADARHWMEKDHGTPNDRLRVVLHRRVTCAGRVVVPAGLDSDTEEGSYLHLQSLAPGTSEGASISAADGYRFSFDGMSAGRFYATIYIAGVPSKRVEFELGPAGETELVLEYEPER